MSKMNDRFQRQIFDDFAGDEVMTWLFVVCQIFIMTPSSTGEVGFVGRAIGIID